MTAASTVEGLERRIKKMAEPEEIQEILHRHGITAEKLILQLKAIAFNNIGDHFTQDKHGRFALTLAELAPEQTAAISEVFVDVSSTIPHPHDPRRQVLKAERIRIKVADKTPALMALVRLAAGDLGTPGPRETKAEKKAAAQIKATGGISSRMAKARAERERLEGDKSTQ